MSVKQFKFVSPGVFINEIDNSALNNVSDAIGPTIIGRLERGPSMRPVKVQSYSEFINLFGEAMPGGDSRDVWRNGNYTAPTYAAYAAQAYLRNSTPVNVVRLLGAENPDRTDAGKAGWKTATATYTSQTSGDGGAYGLYIFPSASAEAPGTGSLAAIWYCEDGHIALTGAAPDPAAAPAGGYGIIVKSVGTDYGFKGEVKDSAGAVIYTTEFNFNEASDKFIRKVFNTNPTLTNSEVGSAALTASYWLGESYETWLTDGRAGHALNTMSTTAAGGLYGIILPLQNAAGNADASNYQKPLRSARTPNVFSQDLSNDTGSFQVGTSRTPNLFHFETINAGQYEGQRFKISIEDIRESTTDDAPYGSFTVVLRNAMDSDSAVRFIERYSQCNLDPQSENYVARKIGDKYLEWDDTDGRYREYGRFNNQSAHIRVVMSDDVDTGLTDERLLPAGFRGPVKYEPIFLKGKLGGGNATSAAVSKTAAIAAVSTLVPAKGTVGSALDLGWNHPDFGLTASCVHPGHLARNNSSNAPSATKAYFGFTTSKSSGSAEYGKVNIEYARPLCSDHYDSQFNDVGLGDPFINSFIFTLDDLSGSVNAGAIGTSPSIMNWNSGSRNAGTSFRGASGYGGLLKAGFDQFSLPLFGGNDGLNVKEMEPFRNSAMGDTDSATTNYAVHSIRRAVESVSDPEVVDTNMISMPGLTHQGLITRVVRTCEDRADALAVVDLKGGYQPNTEAVGNEKDRRGSLDSVISTLQALQENSSYACAYYPWVQIRDPEKGALVWVPPSVAAIGVFATTEKKDELWFAPAGFNRGGLSNGDAGLPVVGTSQRLTSKERDNLYEANINPIANFPNEGIVVFGQKTLQVTPSALDRINVRRLMNYVKKEISRMATDVLFEPNVEATWNGFVSRVKPFLNTVKNRFGLSDFKVVLDETTTTPELIDRNIVYAKIFLKPTKAIEYIAIDFNITNSGASFED